MTRLHWLWLLMAMLCAACAGGRTALTAGSPTPTPSPTPSATGSAPLLPLPGSGVRGRVTAGPTCPVERAGQPCPPDPVNAVVTASDGSGAIVGTTHTLPDGRYALGLKPGRYTITADPGHAFPRCPPSQVTVPAAVPVEVDIICDTGIR